jgi:hypothetical protein
MEWSVYDPTFIERMEAGKDAAILRRDQLAYLGARIVTRRPKPLTVSVEEAAIILGVSAEMVRRICRRGGIVGAKRVRVGRGKGWAIPAITESGVLTIRVQRGKRGPSGKYQETIPL